MKKTIPEDIVMAKKNNFKNLYNIINLTIKILKFEYKKEYLNQIINSRIFFS